jgi:hypothetical protein
MSLSLDAALGLDPERRRPRGRSLPSALAAESCDPLRDFEELRRPCLGLFGVEPDDDRRLSPAVGEGAIGLNDEKSTSEGGHWLGWLALWIAELVEGLVGTTSMWAGGVGN